MVGRSQRTIRRPRRTRRNGFAAAPRCELDRVDRSALDAVRREAERIHLDGELTAAHGAEPRRIRALSAFAALLVCVLGRRAAAAVAVLRWLGHRVCESGLTGIDSSS